MRSQNRKERCIRMIGVSRVVEEPRLIPLAATDVGLGRQLSDHPAVRRVDRNRLTLHVLALHERFVSTLDETSEMMVDVMLGVPFVPGQMPVQRLHVVSTADHESVRAIDVVRAVNVLADSVWRMFSGVQMLAAKVGQSPIRWQLIDELVQLIREVFCEPGVIFKHHVRIDVLAQTLFQDQEMRSIASPSSVAGSPLRRCRDVAPVNRRKPLWFGERPGIGQLFQPLSESIRSAIEIDKKTAFDDRAAIQFRRLARMALRGIFARTCGWRC